MRRSSELYSKKVRLDFDCKIQNDKPSHYSNLEGVDVGV